MAKAMSAEDWMARAYAFEKAAEHLDQAWTDDPRECEQGHIVAGKLNAEASKCRRIARSSPDPLPVHKVEGV